jgi:transcriptional antiterminator
MATTQGRGGILTIPEIAKYLKVTERTISMTLSPG